MVARIVRVGPVVLLAVYTGLTALQVRVWRSELTLWGHAVAIAPLKPRPALNLALALILRGDLPMAEQWLYRTLALADQPHVPAYDRADAVSAVSGNLQTVAIMQAVLEHRP